MTELICDQREWRFGSLGGTPAFRILDLCSRSGVGAPTKSERSARICQHGFCFLELRSLGPHPRGNANSSVFIPKAPWPTSGGSGLYSKKL